MPTLLVDDVGWHLRRLARQPTEPLPWSALAPIALKIRGIDAELLAIIGDVDVGARPWLLRVAAENQWPTGDLAQDRLLPLLDVSPSLSPDELLDAQSVLKHLDNALVIDKAELTSMDDDDLEEWSAWVEEMTKVREVIALAIGRSP